MISRIPKFASTLTSNSTGGYDWCACPFGDTWTWDYSTPKSKDTEEKNRVNMRNKQRAK